MPKQIVNPRLIDVFGADFSQDDVGFAIPKLHSDIPLYVDPFLLWISNKDEYQALHTEITGFFAAVSADVRHGRFDSAAKMLAGCREPVAMGLGYASQSRRGSNIGSKLIADILRAHDAVPRLKLEGVRHLEELQLVVPNFAEDRASDTASAIIKRFFLQYTCEQAVQHKIPTRKSQVGEIFDAKRGVWIPAPELQLPFNPVDNSPILLVPLDMLRRLPWINYGDYYQSSYAPRVVESVARQRRIAKDVVLAFNARHYAEVERYVEEKERLGARCSPDPLFAPLGISTLRAKYRELRNLPTGSKGGADRRYETLVTDLLSSLFYPVLEFAESRVRTISGAHIRDLIFYNDGKTEFWKDVRDRYDGRQPVFEMKNVASVETEHVNQLFRYLDDEFGRFGILVTRNPLSDAVLRNVVDLHSSKRAIIFAVDDRDFELALALAEAGRDTTEVIKKKFVELTRKFPK